MRRTPPKREKPATVADVEKLRAIEKPGRWKDAFIAYRSALANPADQPTAEEARLGAARCLIAMGKPPAALVLLSPLPDKPASDWDRRRLALAAQAMMRQGIWEHAESLAEVALSDRELPEIPALWSAVCAANLARTYLENDKPAKSARLYREAARMFKRLKRPGAAAECMAVALEIEKATAGAAEAVEQNHDVR
jgi:tetratricopeptide (TPR) repeat protein